MTAAAGRLAAFALACAVPAACAGVAPQGQARPGLERLADPADAARHRAAEGALVAGRAAEALAGLAALTERHPDCARLFVELRRALAQVAAPERAVASRALVDRLGQLREEADGRLPEGAPAAANLRFGLALLSDEPDERARLLVRALELDPGHVYAMVLRGEQLWGQGQAERARRMLEDALGRSPTLAEGWLVLAEIHEDNGRYKSADRCYEVYLGLRPFDVLVKGNYARFLVHHRRDGERALAVLAGLIEADPANVEYRLHEAAALWYLGRYAEVERAYKALARQHPEDARIFLGLAELYEEPLDRKRDALQVYRWLLRLPPSSDPFAFLYQSLPVRVRVQRLEQELGAEAPAPPQRLEDIL